MAFIPKAPNLLGNMLAVKQFGQQQQQIGLMKQQLEQKQREYQQQQLDKEFDRRISVADVMVKAGVDGGVLGKYITDQLGSMMNGQLGDLDFTTKPERAVEAGKFITNSYDLVKKLSERKGEPFNKKMWMEILQVGKGKFFDAENLGKQIETLQTQVREDEKWTRDRAVELEDTIGNRLHEEEMKRLEASLKDDNEFQTFKRGFESANPSANPMEAVIAYQKTKKPLVEINLAKEEKTEQERIRNAEIKADIVLGKVDDALGMLGSLTTGIGGSVMSRIPGTQAMDLEKTLDTIRAQIGFAELEAMRRASPTGGALGQVAVKEIEFLQAAIASLDIKQSEDQIRKNLNAIKRHYTNWQYYIAKDKKDRLDKAEPKSDKPITLEEYLNQQGGD